MFPISDDNPEPGVPFVTWGLIAACVAVFLLQYSLPPGEAELAVYHYGFIPGVLFGSTEMSNAPVPAWATIFRSGPTPAISSVTKADSRQAMITPTYVLKL